MPVLIELHFDGDLVTDHRVSVRTLGRSLSHLQGAIDRAYLEIVYGNVWKHARLKAAQYPLSDFLAAYPEEGGFRIKALPTQGAVDGEGIVARVKNAVVSVVSAPLVDGVREATRLMEQAATRRAQVVQDLAVPVAYQDLINNPDAAMVRAYGDRSIAKEIDQILALLRHRNAGDSELELITETSQERRVDRFDRRSAEVFHAVVARRDLGSPVAYLGKLRSLDRGGRFNKRNGKFTILPGEQDVLLHIDSEDAFTQLVPFLDGREFAMLGAPVIEFGAHDPRGGDVYFLGLLP